MAYTPGQPFSYGIPDGTYTGRPTTASCFEKDGRLILDVNFAVKDPQSGEWSDYCNWVDCSMFGTRAEALYNYLSKGMKVAIEGKLRYSTWERDGQKRSKLEVIVDELEFMTARYQVSQPMSQTPQSQYSESSIYESDDIPW